MKKAVLGLIVGSMVFSTGAFAQPTPSEQPDVTADVAQPVLFSGQTEWVALMKRQAQARKVLNDTQQAEREDLLKKHPELAARVAAQEKAMKERAQKRKAEMAQAEKDKQKK